MFHTSTNSVGTGVTSDLTGLPSVAFGYLYVNYIVAYLYHSLELYNSTYRLEIMGDVNKYEQVEDDPCVMISLASSATATYTAELGEGHQYIESPSTKQPPGTEKKNRRQNQMDKTRKSPRTEKSR
jgi:hypothetical protein